jgi:hypothetical protein
MKKITIKKLQEDNIIFKNGFVISSHNIKKIDLVKVPKSISKEEKVKHLTQSLIKMGWKLVEDK